MYPKPIADEDSQAYWDGLRRQELLVQRCGSCKRAQLYFRAICKHCWSRDLTPEAARGKGTIYSFTVIHMAANAALNAETPYPLALVDLDEGPRVLARIDAEPEQVSVDARVTAVFHEHDDWTALHFELESTE